MLNKKSTQIYKKIIMIVLVILLVFSSLSFAREENYWAYEHSNLYEAFEKGLTGKGVKVAIIDEKFNRGIVPCVEYIMFSDPRFGAKDKETGHGTITSSIFYNIAPGAELYLLEASSRGTIIEAYQFCLDEDIDIILMSFSMNPSGEQSKIFNEFFNKDKEVVFISASGNSDQINVYPASLNEVWAVGGVRKINNVIETSNLNNQGWVDFVFDSSFVSTLNWDGSKGYASGTSVSAPALAGMVALLMEEYPIATKDELYELLSRDSFKVDGVHGVFPVYPKKENKPDKPDIPDNYKRDLQEIKELSNKLSRLIEQFERQYGYTH